MSAPRGARVVYAPRWIGDATMSLPTLRALRRADPEQPLVVFARQGPAAIYRAEGSATHVVPATGRFFADATRLRALAPREIWLLALSFRAAFLGLLSGAGERIGFATDRRRFLLTGAVDLPAAPEHQLRSLERLLASRGIATDGDPPRLPASLRENGARPLEREALLGREPVLLAPGAANPRKRWPAEQYGRLASELTRRGVTCAIVIGPGEQKLAREVSAATGSPLPLLGEDLDPAELAGLIAHARALVCNDSGAMHLAAAVGTPVVAIFGVTDPRLTAPRGVPYRLLDGRASANDARGERPMDRITVDEVARALEELLADRKGKDPSLRSG